MKTKNKSKGFWIFLLIAIPLLTVLAALGGAKLILSGALSENKLNLVAYIVVGIISMLAAMFGAFRAKQKKFIWGMLFALGYCIALMLSNLLFFGEGYGEILTNILAVFVGGIIGSLIGAGKRRKIA